jgi:hypothetical protein
VNLSYQLLVVFALSGAMACTSLPAPKPLNPDREVPSGMAVAEEAGREAREREDSGTTGVIFETSRREDDVYPDASPVAPSRDEDPAEADEGEAP